ncbi:MAG TPA: lysophospholipid acyltransferase family protein, partial [Chloroflexota bacterium]|nr:lysophospholipid acyltransferase family protein [Chloroflexota bacterium]
VEARQEFGLRVIHLGRAAVRTIGEELRKNGIVALVCDLPQPPGVEVEFFGRKAMVPSGPGSLAIHHRAPVITARVRMAGEGRYAVHVDPPLDLAGLDRQGIMQQVIRRFETYIRESPEEWFAFKPLFQGG